MVGAIPVLPPPYQLQKITKLLGLNRYGPQNTGMVGAILVEKFNRYGPAGSSSRLILTLKIEVSGLFKIYFQISSFGHPFLSFGTLLKVLDTLFIYYRPYFKFWTTFFKIWAPFFKLPAFTYILGDYVQIMKVKIMIKKSYKISYVSFPATTH